MPRGTVGWLGVVVLATMAGCFKLNPEFVEGGATTGGVGTTVGMTDSSGDSSDTGLPAVSRVDEGLQVLYVFDDEACEDDGVVLGRTDTTPELVLSPCAVCESEGLQINPDSECSVSGIMMDEPITVDPSVGFTIELWLTSARSDNGVVINFGSVLEMQVAEVVDLRYDPGRQQFPCFMELDAREDGMASQHIMATYAGGVLQIYANEAGQTCDVDITLPLDPLDIAMDPSRAWWGTIQLLAIYDRPLDYADYVDNDAAGPWPPGNP